MKGILLGEGVVSHGTTNMSNYKIIIDGIKIIQQNNNRVDISRDALTI